MDAGRDTDEFDILSATIESIAGDGLHGFGKEDTLEVGAGLDGIGLDGLRAFREMEFLELGEIGEGVLFHRLEGLERKLAGGCGHIIGSGDLGCLALIDGTTESGQLRILRVDKDFLHVGHIAVDVAGIITESLDVSTDVDLGHILRQRSGDAEAGQAEPPQREGHHEIGIGTTLHLVDIEMAILEVAVDFVAAIEHEVGGVGHEALAVGGIVGHLILHVIGGVAHVPHGIGTDVVPGVAAQRHQFAVGIEGGNALRMAHRAEQVGIALTYATLVDEHIVGIEVSHTVIGRNQILVDPFEDVAVGLILRSRVGEVLVDEGLDFVVLLRRDDQLTHGHGPLDVDVGQQIAKSFGIGGRVGAGRAVGLGEEFGIEGGGRIAFHARGGGRNVTDIGQFRGAACEEQGGRKKIMKELHFKIRLS